MNRSDEPDKESIQLLLLICFAQFLRPWELSTEGI